MGKLNKKLKSKAKQAIAAVAFQNTKSKGKSTSENDKLLIHKTKLEHKTISKKEKLRQKHKDLMNKFVLLKKQRKEELAQKKREKTAITGDLMPLKDALPSLTDLFELSKNRQNMRTGVEQYDEAPVKLSAKKRLGKKREQFISKITAYEKLLKDPDFKKNPRDVISYHIKYTQGLLQE